ncbi:CdaR family transcriptional regulator [Bacillus cytotoxicus]|uniref:Transcriptional regulator, CdaR n=1 Tax=Bacillus cytotoxicus (strain DSM 22905 / CIP 110041 / 391-98 / NVH 391-98) TaxID=315749 RepID=A7GMI7_BACCN|nr:MULTISPECIES: sugar diacid recognition domain-containing protein [Bacillus cereus group]ABS21345.1 transcriptional regulator, CdaR [Bacillus cytotoxicus NVH 391-98]AWC27993.1 carbohydrate diacid regulator [Bacillus cytotoxicus]AWC40625.1 carbohydrate diacid regulator [Bacillus cytotoxicus]AWC44061.1 carbohydrate diacid regulator [Bacillus cytotoxicus]AWC48556.1 carbohydrate diacid regulator [Bacillus cytotoxicus]
MLSPDLANKIVREVRRLITGNIIIIDIQGIIIASTDFERIGQFHEGALRCAKEKKTVIITKEDEHHLQGVKAGMNLPLLFHNEVIGVIGITGDPKNISPYGEILRKMTELLIHENYFLEQLELKQRSYEAFVFDWLQSKDWSPSFLDRAKTLGIDLYKKKQLVLISFNQEDAMLQRKIWQHIRNLLTKDALFVRWGNDRFILFTTIESKNKSFQFFKRLKQDCEALFPITVYIGIGQTVMPSEMHISYEQALRALSVAFETKGIVFHEDLRLEMCLQDITTETRKEFLKRTIAPLLSEGELMQTLRLFLEHNQSYKQTAKSLHIHINTLHYRLKRVEDRTGLNPKQFKDLIVLYFALLLLDNHTKKGEKTN